MAKMNKKNPVSNITTHEGAPAKNITDYEELRRSVCSCLLWENTFYEDGVSIVERIKDLVSKCTVEQVSNLAIEAREKFKLRHVPLLLLRELARNKTLKADVLERVIQRADELTEFLAIYWKEKREPLSSQVKKGLAKAFTKFSAYDLAKYNQDGAIKLRDVLFLVHAKPKDKEQETIWKKLIDGTLESPDTWEVQLSAGKDKKETWERLLKEKKLGALALLRNLRNMREVKVSVGLIKESLSEIKVDRVLPYRFIAAARYAPNLEPELEQVMYKAASGLEKLSGNTVLLVDVSGSMEDNLSSKSDLLRLDVACGLAILCREICENVEVFTFSNNLVQIPFRRGFALRDAIVQSQSHGGTALGMAINHINKSCDFDRLVVITDEQSHDAVSNPKHKGYLLNVAPYKNGVGYRGSWTHIDGFSEQCIRFIQEYERSIYCGTHNNSFSRDKNCPDCIQKPELPEKLKLNFLT